MAWSAACSRTGLEPPTSEMWEAAKQAVPERNWKLLHVLQTGDWLNGCMISPPGSQTDCGCQKTVVVRVLQLLGEQTKHVAVRFGSDEGGVRAIWAVAALLSLQQENPDKDDPNLKRTLILAKQDAGNQISEAWQAMRPLFLQRDDLRLFVRLVPQNHAADGEWDTKAFITERKQELHRNFLRPGVVLTSPQILTYGNRFQNAVSRMSEPQRESTRFANIIIDGADGNCSDLLKVIDPERILTFFKPTQNQCPRQLAFHPDTVFIGNAIRCDQTQSADTLVGSKRGRCDSAATRQERRLRAGKQRQFRLEFETAMGRWIEYMQEEGRGRDFDMCSPSGDPPCSHPVFTRESGGAKELCGQHKLCDFVCFVRQTYTGGTLESSIGDSRFFQTVRKELLRRNVLQQPDHHRSSLLDE